MEGLPFDSNADSDSTNSLIDKDKAKEKKNRSIGKKRELGKDLVDLITAKDEPETKKSEQEVSSIDADKTPELDTEAPVEHLSEVEVVAINQALASEMLKNIRGASEAEQPVANEDLAAETFLENVEVSGDIEQAFSQAAQELGIDPDLAEAAIIDSSSGNEIETSEAEDEEPAQPMAGPLIPSQPIQISQRSVPAKANANIFPSTPTPPATNFNQQPTYNSKRRESQPIGSGLLLGSIVTYLVGRRRGRIKSERKIAPVQQRLEKEVVELKQNIETKIATIRQLASVKPELIASRPTSIISKKLPPERIGKVLITAETPVEVEYRHESAAPPQDNKDKPPEQLRKQPDVTSNPEQIKLSTQTMNRAELLAIAQKIQIDGASLRQIYEAHLIGEKGLRRVIAVHLRGGNIRRSLKRELVDREIDFERDPKLRDRALSGSLVLAQPNNLDSMLRQSGINWSEPSAAIIIPKVEPPATNKKQDQTKPTTDSSSARRIVDILLVGLIMILAAIIIALILKR